jgi:hypothetical protein
MKKAYGGVVINPSGHVLLREPTGHYKGDVWTFVQLIVVLAARAQSPGVSYVDHFEILGLLPDLEGGLSDITELYLAKFHLLPAGKRVFIRTVQQINGWRDLPQAISARILSP